ncbi:MAG: sulfite exporter TauE/SafE family protein [Longimicrobiaceae bacterium]
MEPFALLAVFCVGLVVGVVSGLVGIGGGVLIVPFLYFFYGHPEIFGVVVPPGLVAAAAHATSLFVIVPTSLRGVAVFHRAGLVVWPAVWGIGAASVFAAVAGARLALLLPEEVLKSAFGALLIFSGLRLAVRRRRKRSRSTGLRLSPSVTVPTGMSVGLFSALLGVGGGIVSIPLLLYVVRVGVRRVAATSMGIIAITATAGTLSYMVAGNSAAGMPPWSVGYVHVAAGVAMFAGSILSVRWGTALNQRLPPRLLAAIFAFLFLVIGSGLVLRNLGGVELPW